MQIIIELPRLLGRGAAFRLEKVVIRLNCGYMPQLTPFLTDDIKYRGVKEFVQRVCSSLVIAHNAIIKARVLSTHQANRLRTKEHPFLIGDLVYLSTANLNLPKWRACK